jgi:hypothetical protein
MKSKFEQAADTLRQAKDALAKVAVEFGSAKAHVAQCEAAYKAAEQEFFNPPEPTPAVKE